ncbi:MAG TPA: hypothetical protein VJZ91_01620 [Blastocatellia bacterium]|nr:hypothetical protein [Blastocatellia bacterium]
MRRRLSLHLALCAALTLSASCRTVQPQTGGGGLPAQPGEAVEDSGRRLTDDYAVESLTDDYLANSVQVPPRWTFSFKGDGTFRSERDGRGSARVETGTYIVGTRGELVLYAEAVAGDALGDARAELYQIEAESGGELRLRRNGSVTLVLRKK